jgi:Tfp pilus assembly protein PilX
MNYNYSQPTRSSQWGAVSLFVVIFSTLLMTIVTVSFVQLMTKDQQQATTSDLSQSAYDSARAGVEDAKRLLLLDQQCRNGTAPATVNCAAVASALLPASGDTQSSCNTLALGGVVSEDNDETLLQQSDGDNAAALDQAYTCVKIAKDTDDYLGDLQPNESLVIPLRGAKSFNTITLSWFSDKDITSDTNSLDIEFPSSGADVSLLRIPNWKFNYPALMRTQLIQVGSSFELTDFNDSPGGNLSNSNTLFLYPSETGATSKDFSLDARYSPLNAPQPIRCRSNLNGGGYACSVEMQLPVPIKGSVGDRTAFLHLSALYNPAHFKIQLSNGTGTIVKFSNVQPEVDSTGRANNLFRRVVSRVELRGDVTYPNAEIDVTGDLCKNFSITTRAADYKNSSTCTP